MNETFTSKIVDVFKALEPILEQETGGPVHLIRIIGPRSSYVAGRVSEEMPFVVSKRVMLSDEWALLFYPAEGRDVDSARILDLFEKKTRSLHP